MIPRFLRGRANNGEQRKKTVTQVAGLKRYQQSRLHTMAGHAGSLTCGRIFKHGGVCPPAGSRPINLGSLKTIE
jgi:hypothetical protein